MSPGAVSFWLLPAEPARAALAAQIEELSREHAAVAFAPHITVHVQTAASLDPAATSQSVLARAAAGPDNDCFFVLGRVWGQEITAERLAEREQRLRAFMAEEPLQLVIDRDCLRLVHYSDPTLPLDRSVAYPLSAVANLELP